MVVQWNTEKHALGIGAVDRQHQEFFVITNQLAQAQELAPSADRKIRILAGLKRLYAYCHFHFNDEEALLRDRNYPELARHRQIHGAFTGRIKDCLLEARDQAHPDLSGVLDALVMWIVDHITGEDRTYADYFRSQGISLEPAAGQDSQVHNLWVEKQLALEIQGIDDQHRQLIAILQQANDLSRAALARQRMFLPNLIRQLFYYAQYHFSFEEELMSRHNWAGIQAHRKLHNFFIEKVRTFADQYKKSALGLSEDLVVFLKDWTIQHILVEDRKFKDSLD